MMIQEDTYKTIIGVAEGIYTEKRSKFTTYSPVNLRKIFLGNS